MVPISNSNYLRKTDHLSQEISAITDKIIYRLIAQLPAQIMYPFFEHLFRSMNISNDIQDRSVEMAFAFSKTSKYFFQCLKGDITKSHSETELEKIYSQIFCHKIIWRYQIHPCHFVSPSSYLINRLNLPYPKPKPIGRDKIDRESLQHHIHAITQLSKYFESLGEKQNNSLNSTNKNIEQIVLDKFLSEYLNEFSTPEQRLGLVLTVNNKQICTHIENLTLNHIPAGIDLKGTNLHWVNLKEAQLGNCNLEDSDWEMANLMGANLSGSNLRGINLEDAILENADLSHANLQRANLERANLKGANLQYANLEVVNLSNANLHKCILSGANLQGCILFGANLQECDLSGANLQDCNLSGANLQGCNLSGAKLDCSLLGANLQGCILLKADQKDIVQVNSNLQDYNLSAGI